MSVQYGGDKITFADGSTVASGWSGFKNRIINGDMRINQRGASSITADGYFVDRWRYERSVSSGTYTASTSTDVPAGFITSMQIAVTTADTSLGASEFLQYTYFIEGLNVADLGWGTANAQTVTLSFWFKASQTGTYAATLSNHDGSRVYSSPFTVSSAGTWEYKTITVVGPTSGVWYTNTDIGIGIRIGAAYGSSYGGASGNSWASTTSFANGFITPSNSTFTTTGAYIRLTGVQLEKGSTATSFDYRPYGTELALCQRYYEPIGGWSMTAAPSGTRQIAMWSYKVQKRATPTITITNTAGTVEQNGTLDVWSVRLDNITVGVQSTATVTASAEL